MIPTEALFEVHLPVAEMDRSLRFYRDRLGLMLAHMTAGRRAAFLWIGAPGAAMLGLWESGPSPQQMVLHLALRTSVDAVIAAPRALAAAGIAPLDFDGHPCEEPVVLAWMPAIAVYFRDPDGHLLEYIAMLPDAPRPEMGVLGLGEWSARQGR
jgi:lactoylglutathione lyase